MKKQISPAVKHKGDGIMSAKEILESIINSKQIEISTLETLLKIIPWSTLSNGDEQKLRLYFSKMIL